MWYCNKETNHTVPSAFDKKLRAKDAVAKIACGLTPIVWGVDKTWVVLKPPAGRETWPHGTKPAKGQRARARPRARARARLSSIFLEA